MTAKLAILEKFVVCLLSMLLRFYIGLHKHVTEHSNHPAYDQFVLIYIYLQVSLYV